jgi:hypothetical protein
LAARVFRGIVTVMNKTACVMLGVPLAAGVGIAADTAPSADISNGQIQARLYLPDARNGYYRGTRFDWSGVIGSLKFAGHEFYPPWFQRTDPAVHDFVYAGADIVAGPCTAITGPSEEFVANGKALGFDDAKPGGTFIKIGVGVLRRPDDQPYDPYRLYPLADGGRWTVDRHAGSVEFRQEVTDPETGYGYDYRKTVSLVEGQARMAIAHTLRNTGRRTLETSVYNHNFLYLDRQAPGPGLVLTVPFQIQADPPLNPKIAEVRGNQLLPVKTLTGEESIYTVLSGFGASPKDYDFRVESRDLGVGVRITADRPLAKAALWAIRAPHSIEPFVAMRIEPGEEFTWRLQYDYHELPKRGQ